MWASLDDLLKLVDSISPTSPAVAFTLWLTPFSSPYP